MVNSLVKTVDAYLKLKFVMELMIVRIMLHLMRLTIDVLQTLPVLPIISSAKRLTFVWNLIGFVMEITTAVTILMKMQFIAHKELALKIHSDVQIIVVFLPRGIVMVMMIVEMEQTSLQNTASLKEEHALEIFSLVTMAIVFLEFISAMVNKALNLCLTAS